MTILSSVLLGEMTILLWMIPDLTGGGLGGGGDSGGGDGEGGGLEAAITTLQRRASALAAALAVVM